MKNAACVNLSIILRQFVFVVNLLSIWLAKVKTWPDNRNCLILGTKSSALPNNSSSVALYAICLPYAQNCSSVEAALVLRANSEVQTSHKHVVGAPVL